MLRLLYILFVIILFFFITVPHTAACESIGSPWYEANYSVDDKNLPKDVRFNDKEQSISYQGAGELLVLSELTSSALGADVPGYETRYKLTKGGVYSYNSLDKVWKEEQYKALPLYHNLFIPRAKMYSKSGGGRPKDLPRNEELTLLFAKGARVVTVPATVSYSFNPTYDPWLQDRPDRICGAPYSENVVVGMAAYIALTPLLIVDSFSKFKNLLAYDLSMNSIKAQALVIFWSIFILAVLTVTVRYFLKKKRGKQNNHKAKNR